jgi:ABC-type multidrug transport system ATPase subunit
MAEVESDPDVASLVVVLDDPMSSFDEDRKLLTIKKLKLLKTKVRQIVLLTHEQSFLKMLSQRVGPHAAFKITFDEAQDTSKIEILDVNEEYIDAFIFDIKNLHALLSASDDDVTWEKLRCMRDVIEHIQKKKYYLILQDEINAGKSVGAFTAKLKAEGIYTEATATAIGELYSHFWNHDDSDKVISRGDFTPGDLRSVVSDFFEVLIVV